MNLFLPRHFAKVGIPIPIYLALAFLYSSLGYAANTFDCESSNCNLRSADTYPHIVVGTAAAVATDEQARQVYRWAKGQDYWPRIPEDEDQFVQLVQVMSVQIPSQTGTQALTLLMAKEEYDASPITPGDFVRYTPHTVDEPQTPLYTNPVAKKYWDLFGCIAALCRFDDAPCPSQYVSGIYRFKGGIQLDSHAKAPLVKGVHIDTQTYLPLVESTVTQP